MASLTLKCGWGVQNSKGGPTRIFRLNGHSFNPNPLGTGTGDYVDEGGLTSGDIYNESYAYDLTDF